MEKLPPKIDILLEPLVRENNEQTADDLLLQLINSHAQPVIKGVIRYKLRLSSHRGSEQAEVEDIYQDVLLQLLSQLHQFRDSPDSHPISDLRGMAAIIAHRTCSRWMRRQFPERHALKNRLHYLLRRQRGFALWEDADRKSVAGFASWQVDQKNARVASLENLADNDKVSAHIRLLKSGKQQELAEALAAIFDHAGGPVEFDELVTSLATILGVRDQPVESISENEDAFDALPAAGEPDQAWRIEKRIFLQRLWEELQQLPVNQRSALLLNLKDASGTGCITLFPATGIASLKEIAETLSIALEKFAVLWNDLPLEDSQIAELLGLTRQQVINARKSGRERLARRLKGFF